MLEQDVTPGLVVQDATCGDLVAGTVLGSVVICQFRPLGSTAYIKCLFLGKSCRGWSVELGWAVGTLSSASRSSG